MDASGTAPVYYLFQHYNNPSSDASIEPKLCSIRGCTETVTNESSNKMCDVCRGRHRVYARTKRAKQKLEKASPTNSWVLTTGETYPQETLSDSHQSLPTAQSSTSASPLPTTITWDTPMFMGDNTATGSIPLRPILSQCTSSELANALIYPSPRMPLDTAPASVQHTNHANQRLIQEKHTAMQHVNPPSSPDRQSSLPSDPSELANALTYPPPRTPVAVGPVTPKLQDQAPVQEANNGVQPSSSSHDQVLPTGADQDTVTFQDSSAPARFCSVKGCKAVIPGSYDFKMCPPCRERYRIYGNTKRAKWKYERESFDREMSTLRAAEDEKRKAKGLGPLADNLEELRAWESSIIDEEVPTSPGGAPSADASRSTSTNLSAASDTGGRPPTLPHSMVLAGIYPSLTRSSIDSPHSLSPYPLLTDPLPARMCTVSHCHKILPGYYRYKRCEQHRLQNRQHSRLQRTREKEEKSIGPEEHMEPLIIPDEVGTAMPKQKKLKGQGKKAKNAKDITTQHSGALGEGAEQRTIFVSEYEHAASAADINSEDKKRAKNVCATIECHNLLFPGGRWRNCDDCREVVRRLKFQARAAQKAAENQYWRGVAERMSVARKSEENNDLPIASGSGSGSGSAAPANTAAASNQSEETSNADADGDAAGDRDSDPDADGDAETDPEAVDEAQVMALVNEETPSTDLDLPQAQGRQLVWKLTETGRPESPPLWARGYNKFRVSLPPTPPPLPPLPTAEELMKLDDPLAFRAFKPTTTPSAIGRILARNPQISVEAFSAILEADSTKGEEAASSAAQVQTEVPVSKSVPTPTIPTSAPFVYKVPEKKATQSTPASKGKRKATSQERSNASTSGSRPTSSAPINHVLAPPPPPFVAPYGYPPSYPYYPYYLPPYQMPPYPYGHPPISAAAERPTTPPKHPHASIPTPTTPPNFLHYPYPPQGYGYMPGHPPMSYMAPRYPPGAAPSSSSGQQQYPPYYGYPPPVAPIPYPYYPPPSSVSAPAAIPASKSSPFTTKPRPVSKPVPVPKPAPASKPAPDPPNSPPFRLDLKKDGNFNHYHYGLGTSKSATTPEQSKQRAKRRKVDPDYLTKYQSLISTRTMGSGSHQATPVNMNVANTIDGATIAVSAPGIAVPVSGNPISNPTTQLECTKASPSVDDPGSPQSILRTCITKTCQRTIEANVSGNICEKCKLKFKKRQAKTKQKFKLEPRKFLLDKDLVKKAD